MKKYLWVAVLAFVMMGCNTNNADQYGFVGHEYEYKTDGYFEHYYFGLAVKGENRQFVWHTEKGVDHDEETWSYKEPEITILLNNEIIATAIYDESGSFITIGDKKYNKIR